MSAFAVAVSVALYVWVAKSATNRLLAISLALVIYKCVVSGNAQAVCCYNLGRINSRAQLGK